MWRSTARRWESLVHENVTSSRCWHFRCFFFLGQMLTNSIRHKALQQANKEHSTSQKGLKHGFPCGCVVVSFHKPSVATHSVFSSSKPFVPELCQFFAIWNICRAFFLAKEQKVREAIEPMMPEAVGMMVAWEPPRCFFLLDFLGVIFMNYFFWGKGNIFKARCFFLWLLFFFGNGHQ